MKRPSRTSSKSTARTRVPPSAKPQAAKHKAAKQKGAGTAKQAAGAEQAPSAASPKAATPAATANVTPATKHQSAMAAVKKQIAAAEQRRLDANAEQRHLDELRMRRALALAESYRGRTSPNPIVGCVIVDAVGSVIAEGVHRGPGTKHAEIDALEKLGSTAKGGTLYVNLEPCTHYGRTPPCAPVVAAAGLARVVVGSADPVDSHGGGIEQLRAAGIVVSRLLVDECDEVNRPFFTWARHRRPAFTLKAAITLDGKIATVSGESRWITGDAARAHVHRLRNTHDAVLVGSRTVLLDDPQLTARFEGARDPMRIVLDSELRTPLKARLLPRGNGPRTIIATTEGAPKQREKALVKAGAEVWRFPATPSGQVPLDRLVRELGASDITSVLVEGGGEVHASFLHYNLADEVVLYIAPKAVGGPARSWVGGKGIEALEAAYNFRFVGQPQVFGEDLMVRAVRT